MPCRPPLCACDFVLVHPPGTHTQTSTSRGLPKRFRKSSGTCFRVQQPQVGQRRAPSVSMTPSSCSKAHCGGKLQSGISEPEITLIDVIFITLSLERTLSQFCSGHRGPGFRNSSVRPGNYLFGLMPLFFKMSVHFCIVSNACLANASSPATNLAYKAPAFSPTV